MVVGGGYAGSYVARCLGKRGATIVNPQNSMLFSALLPEAASGTLGPRHVVVPLRAMCPHAELVLGNASRFPAPPRQVESLEGPEHGWGSLCSRELDLALSSRGSPTRARPRGPRRRDPARNHVLQRLEAAVAEQTHRRRERRLRFIGPANAGVEARLSR